MNNRKPKILIVDDEPINLNVLQNDLEDAGYDVIRAEDGRIAIEKLHAMPDVEVIVLDRMMPNMDGLEVTRALKSDSLYRHIPIIMQTAAGQSHQVEEGVAAGVFYYLIKPFSEKLLLSLVKNALGREIIHDKETGKIIPIDRQMYGLVESANVRFRTLQDVNDVAFCVARCCPRPDSVIYGLNELMINAVEHGNLDITYMEKLELVLEGRWQQEVEARLAKPENAGKYATLTYEMNNTEIIITIKDQGKGFKWESYLDFDPVRMATDPHGKGIAIAKVTSFPNLEYRLGGTEVVCRIPRE